MKKTGDSLRFIKFCLQAWCVAAVAVGVAGCSKKRLHKSAGPAPAIVEPATSIPAATSGKADSRLVEGGRQQLEKLQYSPMPLYSKAGTLGIVRLADANNAILENAIVILGGEILLTNTRLKLSDGNVFFNVDTTGPAKVGDFEIKKGECVLFKDGKFSKLNTVISATP
jgi:hypothetical protein